jgi:hypothetical protein
MDRASRLIFDGFIAILMIVLWCASLATAVFAAYKYATPIESFTTVGRQLLSGIPKSDASETPGPRLAFFALLPRCKLGEEWKGTLRRQKNPKFAG